MVNKAGQQISEEELAEVSVRCLILGLHGMNLLLPNTMVAEVIDTIKVTAAANTPEWLSGFVSWRGRNVALVSFEKLLGLETVQRHDDSRMVILNTVNDKSGVSFIALEVQGLPHLSLLKHGMLEYDDNNNDAEPVVLARMVVDGESVIVPNVEVIERMLHNLGISA
ncbi:MAG: chemotaxis protein CheW [Pseudomonadota bacterium]